MKRIGKGFTVIELVVAVTIVCLLVAVAVASYQDHMARKARTQARAALVEAAESLRAYHARTGSFLGAVLPAAQTPGEGEAMYRISLAKSPVNASDPAGAFPATSDIAFTVQAVPVGGDSCGTMLLDDAGRKGVTGSSASAAECWGQ